MDVVACVHELQALQHLVEDHQGRLKTELPTTETEKALQAWSKQVSHQKHLLVRCRNTVHDQLREVFTILQLLVDFNLP